MKLKSCVKCGCEMVLKHYKQPDSDGPFNSHNPQHEIDYVECVECHSQWEYVTPISEACNPEDLADSIAEKFAASLVYTIGKNSKLKVSLKQEPKIPPIVTAWNTDDADHVWCHTGTRYG